MIVHLGGGEEEGRERGQQQQGVGVCCGQQQVWVGVVWSGGEEGKGYA